MTISPSVEKTILVLKQEFKARGIRRRDVAGRLGVSEVTAKRSLNGRNISVATLEGMAGLVDLDLLSLAALAQEQSAPTPPLSKAQQAALGASRALASIYILLVRGWTPEKIEREFALSPDKDREAAQQARGLGPHSSRSEPEHKDPGQTGARSEGRQPDVRLVARACPRVSHRDRSAQGKHRMVL
jgi:transcriptional regulator with XRE-family HTH domain